MPSTAGNDTIDGGALFSDLDGGAGNDLLFLRYTETDVFGDDPIAFVDIALSPRAWNSRVWVATTPGPYPEYDIHEFVITGIERLNFIGAQHAPNRVYAVEGRDTLQGGSHSDTLFGGSGGDFIIGGMGDDSIGVAAVQGRDLLYGGQGNDHFAGIQFQDTLYGGDGYDTAEINLTGQSAVNLTLNQLRNSANWHSIEDVGGYLTFGDDTLRVTDINMMIHGNAGNDLLIVDRAGLSALEANFQHMLVGGFERVTYYASTYDDDIDGTPGNDTVYGQQGNDIIRAGAGDDLLFGGIGNDSFMGVDDRDTVTGGAGTDFAEVNLSRLTAGVVIGDGRSVANITGIERFIGVLTRFDDVVYGGAYVGNLAGWQGVDRLVLDYSGMPAIERSWMNLGGEGPQSIVLDVGVGEAVPSSVISGFEIYDITASAGRDEISTASGNDTIRGGGGDDWITPGAGNDLVYGGDGNDQLGVGPLSAADTGSGGVDTVYGGNGEDYLIGGLEDRLDGGAGNDTLVFDFASRVAAVGLDLRPGAIANWTGIESYEGEFTQYNDAVVAGAIGGTLDAGAGFDTLVVLAGAEGIDALWMDNTSFLFTVSGGMVRSLNVVGFERFNITGTAGNDTISATGRNDLLRGGAGNDSIQGQDGADVIYGDDGDDWIAGGAGLAYLSDLGNTISGGTGNDTLLGQSGADLVAGDAGNDEILGGGGNDTIAGGDGHDWIEGEAGDDVLAGGLGGDLFVFAGNVASGIDVISDFSVVDDAVYVSGGIRRGAIRVINVGEDLHITWANGTIVLDGLSGQGNGVTLFTDATFL